MPLRNLKHWDFTNHRQNGNDDEKHNFLQNTSNQRIHLGKDEINPPDLAGLDKGILDFILWVIFGFVGIYLFVLVVAIIFS
jgi:hypothetical protein